MYDAEQEAENREIPQTMGATYEKRKGQFCRVYTVKIHDSRQEQLEVPIETEWLEKTILARTYDTKEKTVVIDSSMARTELCTFCGRFVDGMSLLGRTFRCPCRVEMYRDIHAAGNMVRLDENNVGGGRTNLKRVEMKALVASTEKNESASFNL